MRIVMLLALLTCPSPDPPPEAVPGCYRLEWGASKYLLTLRSDRTLESLNEHCGTWDGTWLWDRQTRTLTVLEWARVNPGSRVVWKVQLDEELMGKTDGGIGVRLRR